MREDERVHVRSWSHDWGHSYHLEGYDFVTVPRGVDFSLGLEAETPGRERVCREFSLTCSEQEIAQRMQAQIDRFEIDRETAFELVIHELLEERRQQLPATENLVDYAVAEETDAWTDEDGEKHTYTVRSYTGHTDWGRHLVQPFASATHERLEKRFGDDTRALATYVLLGREER